MISSDDFATRPDRVHVVDDDVQVRQSLCAYLRTNGYMSRGFPCAADLLESLNLTPDVSCVVVDVKMPGMSGLELIVELVDRGLDVPTIVITGHGDVSTAVQALKLGAVDFLEKPFDPSALKTAIAHAIKNSDEGRHRTKQLTKIKNTIKTLPDAHVRILWLVAQGKTSKEIALAMGLSHRTIESYRRHLMDRLGVSNAAGLIRAAVLLEDQQIGQPSPTPANACPVNKK